VLRAARGEEALQRRDVARRRRADDALVQRRDVRRQRAPAGDAGAAETLRIDLWPAGEIVEGANAIPDAITGGPAADEQGADTDHRVLVRAGDDRLPLVVEDLHALALADRVVGHGGDAVGREQHGLALVIGLAG